jgi:putative lipoprotein
MPLIVSRRAVAKASLIVATMAVAPSATRADNTGQSKNATDGLFDIEWRLTELAGTEPVEGHVPTLILREDGKAGGDSGCNVYFASAEIDGSEISFSEIGSTKIACEQPVMDQERALFEALESTAGFDLSEDGLELLDKDGALLLRFTAAA